MKAKTPFSLDVTHTTLAVLFIGMLIVSSFWILQPFLVALTWASIIAVATWPVLLKLQAMLGGRRGLAVTVMTLMILLVVLVPVTFAIFTIVRNSENISAQVRSFDSMPLPMPPEWVKHIPLKGEKIADRWKEVAALTPEERSAMLTPYAQKSLQWFAEKAGSFGITMLHFLLTAIIAAILFANGEVVREGILRFARRLAGKQGEEVAILAAKAVRGVVLGVVVTALIQAAIGAIGLFITGVPAAALLTAVMLILCIAQIGPLLVLIPSIIWLYSTGQPVWGTILLVISLIAGTIDNVIRPFLIRKGADLPLLVIFTGVIGGLTAFGIIGLFIGPVILAVTYTLLKAWVTGSVQEDEAGSSTE
ncbi:MAG TPA: AI-2E family transporter YdiK [Nitrospirota bacterium]|nr:AI-2E family transporter YdiK [Nitrospirota bacterium]